MNLIFFNCIVELYIVVRCNVYFKEVNRLVKIELFTRPNPYFVQVEDVLIADIMIVLIDSKVEIIDNVVVLEIVVKVAENVSKVTVSDLDSLNFSIICNLDLQSTLRRKIF